ncbi:hypothetical protein [Microbacterium sp. RU33B]|uniref:hypothetical protein n=1 Tax=Microbacterium sp. RU33B TaxID=1907390 RepID=UPI00095DB45B|nr:hypothetical protein [Microbacterium sp. RU33B]SIT86961.1 hypothetical protein SAMN05880545_2708 [Microbacterium sp. RU33B]
MEDAEFDRVLEVGIPMTAIPSTLSSHRDRILAEARARRSRRLRVWTAGVVASVLVVGGGSVAVAGGGNETPWGWVADNVFSIGRTDGSACFQGFLVKWDGVSEDDPMVQDAKAIVGGIDLTTLDTGAVEAELEADMGSTVDGDGRPQEPVVLSEDELRQFALSQLVGDILFAELLARGHELRVGHEVSLSSQTTDCS